MTEPNTAKIRELNDLTRKQIFASHLVRALPCTIVHTQGIEAFSDHDREKIYIAVRDFNSFTESNDPHQEHDFGSITFEGQKIFWKIDYYAHDMQHGSENPADPKQTCRVLTIMLASEY